MSAENCDCPVCNNPEVERIATQIRMAITGEKDYDDVQSALVTIAEQHWTTIPDKRRIANILGWIAATVNAAIEADVPPQVILTVVSETLQGVGAIKGYEVQPIEADEADDLNVNVKVVDDKATLPEYATEGAACFDLASVQDGWVGGGKTMIFRTGLHFEVPDDHVMLVFSRSGHGFKNDVRLANCVGVVDSDYRGEVMVKLTNDGQRGMSVTAGDRIAQAMILPVRQATFTKTDDLSETERGKGGFGSTGN